LQQPLERSALPALQGARSGCFCAGNGTSRRQAWGDSGSVYSTPEWARMMYLDYGLMVSRD
jgi:hypothetical protein